MKCKFALSMAVAALTGALLARPLFSEEGSDKGGEEHGMPEEMKPGPEHEMMAKAVGKYDVDVKFWMGPGEPTASKGTAEFKMILDGRYLQQEFKGEFMGQPFTGLGIEGYDRVAKKFTSYWCDSMSTMSMFSTGTAKDGGKVVEYTGEMSNPQTGKPSKTRTVLTHKSADVVVFEMFEPHEGKEVRTMEITYTRKK